ncbi:MAG TPA: hypothetical protein VL049_02230, partial [Candidatus Dormibacteraeota bacterium]|nr:hypothetical protein [Candidatus Dormibacteraeota bacterium]
MSKTPRRDGGLKPSPPKAAATVRAGATVLVGLIAFEGDAARVAARVQRLGRRTRPSLSARDAGGRRRLVIGRRARFLVGRAHTRHRRAAGPFGHRRGDVLERA